MEQELQGDQEGEKKAGKWEEGDKRNQSNLNTLKKELPEMSPREARLKQKLF